MTAQIFDKSRIRRAFETAPPDNELFLEAGARLAERLDDIALSPLLVADIGGGGLPLLKKKYPLAKLLSVDIAAPVLRRGNADWRVLGDAEKLPIASGVVDLLWSNLCYDWTATTLSFSEAARAMRGGGLLIFSVLGGETLRELAAAARFVDGDGQSRVHSFCDMHDLGDGLLAAGFAEPIMQSDSVLLKYADAKDACREVRKSGCGCALANRKKGLLGKNKWRKMLDFYQQNFSDENGRVTATVDIIYGLAWRRESGDGVDGESPIRFY